MHCQRQAHSCFGCCGLRNLAQPESEDREVFLKRILTGRTHSLSVFSKTGYLHNELVNYRIQREKEESVYGRFRDDIYVCPFLGFLAFEDKSGFRRTGCMIHPQITGRENSQNASFYGASICLTYDCVAKDSDPDGSYAGFIAKNFTDTFVYSRILADSVLYRLLEREGAVDFLTVEDVREAVLKLIRLRLKEKQSQFITSFEVSQVTNIDEAWEEALTQNTNGAKALIKKLRSAVNKVQ